MPTPADPDQATWSEMIALAEGARRNAHAPYSKFLVGAAARAADGTLAFGCNVENASFGLSVCAERNAIARLVAENKKMLAAVVVVTEAAEPVAPCGMCRQVMAEFAPPSMPIVSRTLAGAERRFTLGELLPHAFTHEAFKK